MPASTNEAPLHRLGPGLWRGGPFARGPFAGMQGGLVAAAMAAEIEAIAPAGFHPMVTRADLLRPVPLGTPLQVRVTPVQTGRRLAVFDAVLEADGQLKARCSMTLARDVPVPVLQADYVSDPPPPAIDPTTLPPRGVRPAQGGAWLMDVLDARIAPDRSVWFRWLAPWPGGASAFTAALAPADFAHGLARPGLPGPPPIQGFPNPDLTVHFVRAPRGEWVGVRPATRWQTNGVGMGHGDLVDMDGSFGRVAMGVVLIP